MKKTSIKTLGMVLLLLAGFLSVSAQTYMEALEVTPDHCDRWRDECLQKYFFMDAGLIPLGTIYCWNGWVFCMKYMVTK